MQIEVGPVRQGGGDEGFDYCLKHFVMVEVSAAGREPFRQSALVFLGTGTMAAFLKHVGTTD